MIFEPWWIWMFLAAVFLVGEIRRMGSFCLWLSFGAALSGILALLNIPVAGQAAVFFNISGIMIVLERRFYERYTFKRPRQHYEGISSEPIIKKEETFVFRQTGAGWEIKYGDSSLAVKPSIGLMHIRNLLRNSGEWMHCTELKRLTIEGVICEKSTPYREMTNEELDIENLKRLDDIPPEEIIRRLPLQKIRKLRDTLAEQIEADDFENPEDRIDQHTMLEIIDKYLNGASDIRGHSRKLYDETENDRKAVSAAINRTRQSLAKEKELYTHLKSFIQAEGNSFRYLPDRPIDWITD